MCVCVCGGGGGARPTGQGEGEARAPVTVTGGAVEEGTLAPSGFNGRFLERRGNSTILVFKSTFQHGIWLTECFYTTCVIRTRHCASCLCCGMGPWFHASGSGRSREASLDRGPARDLRWFWAWGVLKLYSGGRVAAKTPFWPPFQARTPFRWPFCCKMPIWCPRFCWPFCGPNFVLVTASRSKRRAGGRLASTIFWRPVCGQNSVLAAVLLP